MRTFTTFAARTAVAGAVSASLVLCSCAAVPDTDASSSGTTAAAAQPSTPPPPRDIAEIVDPSGSVERGELRKSLAAFAAAVRGVPRQIPARGASRGQPAVHVSVRAISGASYDPDGLLIAGVIPAISRVDAPPTAADGDLTEAALHTRDQQRAARAAYAVARARASSLAGRIARLDPPVAGCSDVWGAVSAAAESFSTPDRRLIVVSDLAVHCRSNLAGSLDGVRVLAVHICAQAKVCADQRRYWGRALHDRGAAGVTFVRPELMRERIRAFVQEVQP